MSRFLKLLFIFVIINLILLGIQKITKIDEKKKLRNLEPTIESMEKEMVKQAALLDEQKIKINNYETELDRRSTELDQIYNRYQLTGAPDYVISQFNALKLEYESLFKEYEKEFEKYTSLESSYSSVYDSYSRKYDEYMILSDEASTYFWLIPIPIPKLGK